MLVTGAFFLEKNGFTVLHDNPADLESAFMTDHTWQQRVTATCRKQQLRYLHSHAYKVEFVR